MTINQITRKYWNINLFPCLSNENCSVTTMNVCMNVWVVRYSRCIHFTCFQFKLVRYSSMNNLVRRGCPPCECKVSRKNEIFISLTVNWWQLQIRWQWIPWFICDFWEYNFKEGLANKTRCPKCHGRRGVISLSRRENSTCNMV